MTRDPAFAALAAWVGCTKAGVDLPLPDCLWKWGPHGAAVMAMLRGKMRFKDSKPFDLDLGTLMIQVDQVDSDVVLPCFACVALPRRREATECQ